jgi:hypothetical protein
MTPPIGISRFDSLSHRPRMLDLTRRFHSQLDDLASFEPAGTVDLPPTYATLLSHGGHMTVTLEAYHESLVRVQAIEELKTDKAYARESLLTRVSDGLVVQCGIMRIALAGLPPQVREAIENRSAPLGRILIRNNLLREVELLALWRVTLGQRLACFFRREVGEVVYGRSACIHIQGEPTVELLEIVTDDPRPLPDGI